MARNSEFSDTNLELHRRWVELNEHEDQDSREVVLGKERLANEVIEANRRLIGAEIRKYTARSPQLEPDLFDTAGAELWRAFQRWDPDRGTLRTVAMPYISGAVRREVARHDHPHLTYDDFTLRNKVVTARRQYEAKHEAEPSNDDLSKITGIPADKIAILFAGTPLSLDAPAGNSDEDMTLGAIVASQASDDGGPPDPFAGFDMSLEQQVAESTDPVTLLAFLMKQPVEASAPARTAEVAYMLGAPNNGRAIPGEVTRVALHNSYVKLRELIGETPTAEQLSILASVPAAQAEKFLARR